MLQPVCIIFTYCCFSRFVTKQNSGMAESSDHLELLVTRNTECFILCQLTSHSKLQMTTSCLLFRVQIDAKKPKWFISLYFQLCSCIFILTLVSLWRHLVILQCHTFPFVLTFSRWIWFLGFLDMEEFAVPLNLNNLSYCNRFHNMVYFC